MRRVLDPIVAPLVKLWRDRVWGPRLRTYGEAREELGGVPWRKFTNTERWFLMSQRDLPPPIPEVAKASPSGAIRLDTGALLLARPGLLDLARRHKAWVGGGAIGLAVMLVLIFSSGSPAKPAAAVAPAPEVAAAVPAPAATTPAATTATPAVATTAPAPVTVSSPVAVIVPGRAPAVKPHSGMSSSVRALLAGKSARGIKRPTKLKKIRSR